MYEGASKNFVELVKGSYGKTPFPVDPEFRLAVAGTRDETPYDTSKYKKQDNPAIKEAGGAPLAKDEKDQLLLELFPSVADKYLRAVRIQEWQASLPPPPPPVPELYPAEFWDYLTANAEA